MDKSDWEFVANELHMREIGKVGGTCDIFKDDIKSAHKELDGKTFWGISDQYAVRHIVEKMLK